MIPLYYKYYLSQAYDFGGALITFACKATFLTFGKPLPLAEVYTRSINFLSGERSDVGCVVFYIHMYSCCVPFLLYIYV